MDSPDGRVLIIVIVATILFVAGRNFQRTLDTWAGWGKAVKTAAEARDKIPGAKSSAWAAVRRMIFIGAVTLALLALLVNAFRFV
ncbi:hypothetical protein [Sphaerisporangium album]|uniref:hypothetical protein n=1 Tax=Sphaerisporangium album TaxID=509200 RepID=UPI0011C03156|nr:hypothetical protein [Sphaerisporangium album]